MESLQCATHTCWAPETQWQIRSMGFKPQGTLHMKTKEHHLPTIFVILPVVITKIQEKKTVSLLFPPLSSHDRD